MNFTTYSFFSTFWLDFSLVLWREGLIVPGWFIFLSSLKEWLVFMADMVPADNLPLFITLSLILGECLVLLL